MNQDHRLYDAKLEENIERNLRDAELIDRAKKGKGPQIDLPKNVTLSQASNALKPVLPHLSRRERRAMVKNSKSKGRGYTK